MILKTADHRTTDIEALQALLPHPAAGDPTRRKIEDEIRNIELGVKAEKEAAYEIDFHFGQSPNWAVIHDLRIETEQRVAQIDHLLVNRLLEVWVCETKQMSGGLAINEYGECTTFLKGNRPLAIASPFEQNRKHCALLQALFDDVNFPLPTRLGIKIRPSINNIVLLSKRARITRPKVKIDGIDSIIKADQLKEHIDKAFDDNPFLLAKLIGTETLMDFANVLVSLHCPIEFDWQAKFGLAKDVNVAQPRASHRSRLDTAAATTNTPALEPKRQCVSCAQPVTEAVVRYCLVHRTRFGGEAYCRDCQRLCAEVPSNLT